MRQPVGGQDDTRKERMAERAGFSASDTVPSHYKSLLITWLSIY